MPLSLLNVGCFSDHGGMIITGDPTMIINGAPIARLGDLHSCPQFYAPGVPHAVTPIVAGTACPYRPLIRNQLAALEGDMTTCGAKLLPCGAVYSKISC